MAILDILKFPDPRLRIKAQKIVEMTPELRHQIDDMYETMYARKGVGLAATQVNIHKQFFVMDVSITHDQCICIINPVILHKEGVQYEGEGCLSVVETFDKVKRAQTVHLQAMDIDGKTFELQAEGLMAACIQHEMDHLNGILFIDHLSRLKQERIKTKIDKILRRE
jgi:peptide deformylase